MDVFVLLTYQHRQAKFLLDELAAGEDLSRRGRNELLIELQALMLLHSLAEETVLYPALAGAGPAQEFLRAAERRNAAIEDGLAHLARERDEDRWREALENLRAGFEDHAELEELWIFPVARRTLDNATLRELRAAIESERPADAPAMT